MDVWILEFASDELKGNFDIVMAAIKKKGFTLKYASNGLKGDFDIVMAAV
eukprot:CAMPEP_0171040880 /NCGR_PEP_ID=MMETSP0736-20130129/45010_1 /TAXON_ID=186038 /ORGANISM="Fragilariopsis kerguelensis, Strain L26-C5" /LENGTH=49 /DNA_ID= /DNA_START= /DNA_END= /DNA_ORIENTATION=